MSKFYIIYKDGSVIEGTTSCLIEQFEEKIIAPVSHTIDVWNYTDNEWSFDMEESLKQII